MSCEECRRIIKKLLNYIITGDIEDILFDELIDHILQCPSCEKEFKDFGKFEDTIKKEFSTATTTEQTMDLILSKLRKT
jgi:hypothetical protein